VVWVVSSNIVCARAGADIVVLVRVRGIPKGGQLGEAEAATQLSSHGIAVVVVEQSIDVFAIGETTSKGIERAVLLDQDDHILDLALPVTAMDLDGLRNGQRKAGQRNEGNNLRDNHLGRDWK
jgi:hypothetical protein